MDWQFISPRVHTIIGTVVGLVLLLAPNLLGFSDVGGASVALPRIIGIIIILSELTVQGTYTGLNWVPMSWHIGMDVVLGLFLLISPWLFGFSDLRTSAWLPHVIVGAIIVAYALCTQTRWRTIPVAR